MDNRVQSNMPGAAAILAVALAALLLPWLGETLFYSKGEPREAIVAMTILQSGDWILPVSYGADIPYKPPFLAWLIAIFASVFNGGEVNEYISRLPSALAAFAMVMGGFLWARRERGERFALIFSFVTIGSFEVFRAALACRVDMVLTACMVGAIYIMYYIHEHAPRMKWLLYGAAVLLLSCAMMTKGPVGVLLPCFIIGVYRLLRHDSFFPAFFQMLGVAVAAMILPALWYWAAYARGGDDFYNLMMEENIGRLTGTMSYESHVNPWWYNLVTLVAGLLPWTVLLIAALPSVRRIRIAPLSPAALLSCTVAVLVVLFYTIPSSKRSVYLLPAYPFICYGIALLLDYCHKSSAVRFFAWLVSVLCIIAPLAVVALQIWPMPKLVIEPVPWWRYIVLCIPLSAGIAWMVNRHSATGHICVSVWALYLAYAAVGMPMVLNPRSDRDAAAELASMTDGTIYSVGETRFYSLNFYLGDRMRLLDNPADIQTLGPGATVVFMPADTDPAAFGPESKTAVLKTRGADYRKEMQVARR